MSGLSAVAQRAKAETIPIEHFAVVMGFAKGSPHPVCADDLDVLVRAGLDLDRDVAKTAQAAEPALVGRGRQRVVGNHGNHGGAMTRTDLPEVQIGDAVALGL